MVKIKTEIEKISRELLRFELTEYQAKALAGMFSIGEGTAGELIKVVDVPKARIYGVLDELLEMGAIRKKPGRPTKYIVLSPNESLQNIINWRNEIRTKEIKILSDLKNNLVTDLNIVFEKAKPLKAKSSFFELMPAGETSELETRALIKSAKKWIYIMSGVLGYLPQILNELNSAVKQGAKLKVILTNPKRLPENSKKMQREVINNLKKLGAEIKFAQEMPLRMTLVDSTAVIFSVDEARALPFLKEVAISKNQNFIKAMKHYFISWWE